MGEGHLGVELGYWIRKAPEYRARVLEEEGQLSIELDYRRRKESEWINGKILMLICFSFLFVPWRG